MKIHRRVRNALSVVSGLLSRSQETRARNAERLFAFSVDSMPRERRDVFLQVPPALDQAALEDARLFASREDMLRILPVGGTVAEIGVFRGYFSRRIATTCRPDHLHLIDIDFAPLDRAEVENAADGTTIHIHEGDSVRSLDGFEAGSFDWIYVDGDHSYDGARRDLEASHRVIRAGGYLMCNDYSNWCTNSPGTYGVARAVNEFVGRHGYRVIGFALATAGEPDILIQKPAAAV